MRRCFPWIKYQSLHISTASPFLLLCISTVSSFCLLYISTLFQPPSVSFLASPVTASFLVFLNNTSYKHLLSLSSFSSFTFHLFHSSSLSKQEESSSLLLSFTSAQLDSISFLNITLEPLSCISFSTGSLDSVLFLSLSQQHLSTMSPFCLSKTVTLCNVSMKQHHSPLSSLCLVHNSTTQQQLYSFATIFSFAFVILSLKLENVSERTAVRRQL